MKYWDAPFLPLPSTLKGINPRGRGNKYKSLDTSLLPLPTILKGINPGGKGVLWVFHIYSISPKKGQYIHHNSISHPLLLVLNASVHPS